MTEPRLQILLDRYVDGALSEDDRAELERALLSSPAAREAFWAQARLHAAASRWGQEEWGRRMARESAPPDAGAGRPMAIRRPRWTRWLAVAAAVAVVGAIVATLVSRGPTPVDPRGPAVVVAPPAAGPAGVAVLAAAVEVEWADGPGPGGPGTVVAAGTVLKVAGGAVAVEFYSGARLVIQGPAEVEVRSEMEAYCRRGRLSAVVPVPARGFTISMDGASVVDLGTEFGVDVPAEGPPEVHVFGGIVELRPAAPPTTTRPSMPVRLGTGEGGRLGAGGAVVAIRATPAAFLRERDVARIAAGDARRRQALWAEAATALSRDPAAVAHFTFPGDAVRDRTVPNRVVAGPPAGADAGVVGCMPVDGRWPGTVALEFQGPGDRLRLNVPGSFAAVTLLAWVRVDALTNAEHALLAPDGLSPGTIRWGLSGRGELRFGIARASGGAEPAWEVVIGQPVVTPDRIGRWALLATTYDGKAVRHYVDGRPAGSGAAYSPVPLVIGPAEVGNWRGAGPRFLRGRTDEFAVLSRAMSPQELADLFEAGRPATAGVP